MVFKYFEAGNIDPEELLYYVKTNKYSTIKKLLKNCNDLLYQETENGLTVLESICYHQFTEDLIPGTIVSLLAKVDANKLKPNSQRGYKSLIHFAALGQNPIILEALIIKFPQQVKLKAERNTALHILIKESTSYGPNFLQCIEILLKNGVDIEAKDKLNKTAYDWATEKKLLDDSVLETFRPKTAPKKIPAPPKSESYRSRKSYAIPVNVDYRRSTPMSISPINQINSPMDYLRNLDENGFINYFKTNDSSDINEYLPYAIEHNLLNVVDYMIETNQLQPSENETHPLIIAKNHRHYDMLKLLLEKMEVPSDILFRLIRTADGCINESGFMECYQLIIESDKVDVNLADDYYNTALHCAGKYTRWGIMLLLLKNKASLANCNSDQQMAIVEIDTYVLGKHFDQCVQFGYQRLCEERLRLSFNYATLFPTRNQSKLDSCAESTPCIEDAIVEEDTAGVKLNFNENDQLFTQSNTMGASELEVILHLSNNPDKQSLLLHPLINALIDVIWHKVEIFVFINFIVYMLYCVSLGLHLGFGNNLSKAFLIIMCCVLILRECFQFSYQRASYFKQQNNYIEIAVCIVVALLLMTEKVQFKVVAALLSAFAYLSILDSMPTVASYVNMFQKVTKHCCKVLMIFFVVTLAFAYAFHAISVSPDSDQFFGNYTTSLFKTMVMLSGEYEVSNLSYEENAVLLQVIVILFVFTMSVVLMNLLIALAFADVQQMKVDAKLHEMITRVKYIAQTEKLYEASKRVSHIYLNEKSQMFVSLKSPGKISRNICDQSNKIANKFCIRCLSRPCTYRLSKRVITNARKIALENTRDYDFSVV